MDSIIYVYALFGPFLVWPVERFIPYPFVVEELFKLIVVYYHLELKAKSFLIAGVLFALTETVLYTINVNTLSSVGYMMTRFISSSLLHSITFLIIYLVAKRNKKLIFLGFLLSTLIHFLYNKYIPSFI